MRIKNEINYLLRREKIKIIKKGVMLILNSLSNTLQASCVLYHAQSF